MNKKTEYFKPEYQEEFQKRLKGKIREHRKEKNLTQSAVAQALKVSLDTYRHWEKDSRPLTDIFNMLSVFQVLEFSTAEIVDLLGLAPLTSGEIKAACQDEDMLKSIEGNTIYSIVREKCSSMDGLTLGKLLALLSEENLKRVEGSRDKP